MIRDPGEARALLEAEGWTFAIQMHDGPLGGVELVAVHSELGVVSTTIASTEQEAWDLLIRDGGP